MNKFLDKVPLLPITLGVILGIIASYNHIDYSYVITAFIIALTLTFSLKFLDITNNRNTRRYISIIIPATLIFCISYVNSNRTLPSEFDYTPYSAASVKVEKVKFSDYTSTVIADVISLTDTLNQTSTIEENQRIILYLHNLKHNSIHIGDIITIPARIKPITNRNNPYEFDYVRYMYNNQIIYSAFVQSNEIRIIGHNQNILSLSQEFRSYLIKKISQSSLSHQSQQFLRGVILGEQDRYSNDTRNKFESTGVAHILAVSGLHVGIIFFILNALLWCLRITRTHRYIVLVPILILYCFLTQGSPSVIRATIMLSIALIFLIKGERAVTLNNACLAATLILLFQPLDLFNIGFQLSFLSVIAISLFTRPLNPFHQWQPILFYIGNLVAISIAATIGTLAVTTYYFNSIATSFLIANVTVIPLLPFIFTLGILCIIFSNSQFLCNSFNSIYDTLIDYLTWIQSIQILPTIHNINIGIIEIILYTAAIALLAIYIRNRKRKLLISATILIITTAAITYHRSTADSGEELYILNDHNTLTIFYHKNHDGYLIFSDEKKLTRFKDNYPKLIVNKNIRRISIVTEKLNNTDISVNYPYIQLDTIRIAIINDTQLDKIFGKNAPIQNVNYQVIEDNYFGTLKRLTEYIHADSTILTSSMNPQFGGKMVVESYRESIPTHNTKTEGAWYFRVK